MAEAPTPVRGTLSAGVLPTVLRHFYVGRMSGQLSFRQQGEVRTVRFQRGHIVHASTSVRSEHLGEVLVRNGLLRQDQLDEATAVVVRDKKRLGQVLVESGALAADQLEDALALHVREILLEVFGREGGEFEFKEEPAEGPLEGDVTLKISTGEIILEAVRRVHDANVVRRALGNVDRVLCPSTDPLLRFQQITLTPADGYILSRVDGILSAQHVIQMTPLDREEVERSLYGLLCTGVIEYMPLAGKQEKRTRLPTPPMVASPPPVLTAPPPMGVASPSRDAAENVRAAHEARRREVFETHEAMRTRNHFELLAVSRDASESEIKAAYFRLAKRFHPDSHHDPALSDLRDTLEAVFIALGTAYDTLSDPNRRARYEAGLPRREPRVPPPSASQPAAPPEVAAAPTPAAPQPSPEEETRRAMDCIRRAEGHIEKEEYWDAIQLLETAIPIAQGKLKSRAGMALARAYLKNPKWAKQAESVLLNVTKEDPKNVDAHFMIAEMYRAGGLRSRAITFYRKTLDLNSEHAEAAAALSALTAESAPTKPEGGGLLKKLFRK